MSRKAATAAGGAKELCLALMRADTEAEVISILQDHGYWDSPAVWRCIGDDESNWATIGNQQSAAVAALAEKFINSIDALLLNGCLEAGVDPKGSDAPATMREAVARFFEQAQNPNADHVGRIANWLDDQIKAQARRLTLAATGTGSVPSLSIADEGEGQTPDMVPDTFMSLHKRNKVDIPFVQGKFNMGGTGALYFCGTHKIQLVVTRRNPRLLGPAATKRDAEWSFTLTRREATGARNPVCTYLAPLGASDRPRHGSVLSFAADTMPLLPEASKQVRDAYYRHIPHGSLIKLYEYDFSPRSNIVFTRRGLRQRIETYIPELALPIGVFECRRKFGGAEGGSYFTPARGTATRLEQEKNEDYLEFKPIGGVLQLGGTDIVIKVFAFKRRPDQKKRDGFLHEYAQGAGVLYTVNGQTHTMVSNDFFHRQAVDLDYLRDDLLVTVDCSGLDEIARADLFMNSRDRNRDTGLWKQLERTVEGFLKRNEQLQQLAIRRREEAIRDRTEDNQALADLLDRVLKAAPDLAKVLLGGARLPSPFPKPGTGQKRQAKRFNGKRFPTFFHFAKHQAGEELKRQVEVGRELRVSFVTDAQDDYFWRAGDRGSMSVTLTRGAQSTAVSAASLHLSSGLARWVGELPAGVRTGDILTFDFEVIDPLREEPFSNRLRVEVVPRTDRPSGPSGKTRRANSGQGDKPAEGGLALPEVLPVPRAKWGDFGFDDQSALLIRRRSGAGKGGGGYDFFYNVDNDSLLRAQKAQPADAELTRERFRCALVLVGLALIQQVEGQRRQAQADNQPDLESLVTMTTRALAPVLLPLVEFVGTLSVTPP
ncbi:MAG: hypothetical protein AB1673_07950 [Actinomycetota bacterium]